MPRVVTGSPAGNEDLQVIPDGEVVGVSVLGVEEVPNPFATDEDRNQTQFQWEFVITDEGPFQGRRIRDWSSTNFVAHPNCKAYIWSKAILRKDFHEGEAFDTDDLIGHSCRLALTLTKNGKFNKILNVLPARNPTQFSNQSAQEAPF